MHVSRDMSDEELFSRFQAGERNAFAGLVRRHQTGLYNFVLRHVRSGTQAEDLVQETFVRAVQSAADFKHESKFSTWIYSIARNLCLDQLRKNALRNHPSLDESRRGDPEGPTLGEALADSRADVERDAGVPTMQQRIALAVEQLPEDQREVFLLREIAALPFKEIAAMIGVPENTVKSRMRYALERLQAKLSDYEDEAKALR